MKKIIFLLLFTNLIFSQEIDSENYFWEFNYMNENGIEAVIGAKNCYIRQDATSNSQLLDSLQIGDKIKVIKNTTENLNIKGLNLSWVEIEYSKNNQIKTGFLWKGFIAVGNATKENTTFLTTIDSKYSKKIQRDDYEYERDFYKISVKAINLENQIISEKSFSKELSESHFFQNSAISSWGLKDLNSIYRISFSGEACGIPTLYYYFGWNEKEFLLLPEKYDMGDAGVFYHSEEFIFPKEKGGQTNTIIKTIKEAENTDENSNTYDFLVTKTTEYYSWDGKNFKLIKTKKLKPYIEKED
jgi:starvation-inducible outer membrane lipoprotein